MNLSEIKKLIRIFENSGVAEIEVEQDGLRVQMKKEARRERHVVHIQPEVSNTPVASNAPEASNAPVASNTQHPSAALEEPAESSEKAEAGGHVIKAPMVGTFFRSPSPTSPPFIEEGDIVRIGQALCVIEAMKLMNEIESDVEGRIVSIFAENGKPVEFGMPLFAIEPR